jgi:hypothetical protein
MRDVYDSGMRNLILLLGLLVVGCKSTEVMESATAIAMVQSTQGRTEVRRAGGDWQMVQAGDRLTAGDELRTDATAQMDLNLGGEAGILTLHPNSQLRIDRLRAGAPSEAPVELTLSQGRITGDTLRAPGKPKVKVNTGKGSVKVP